LTFSHTRCHVLTTPSEPVLPKPEREKSDSKKKILRKQRFDEEIKPEQPLETLKIVIDSSEVSSEMSSQTSSPAEPLTNSAKQSPNCSPSKTVSVTVNDGNSRPAVQVPDFTVSKVNEYSVQTVDLTDSKNVVFDKISVRKFPGVSRENNGSRYTVSEIDRDENGNNLQKSDGGELNIEGNTVRSKV
jgi:hypothetical protein